LRAAAPSLVLLPMGTAAAVGAREERLRRSSACPSGGCGAAAELHLPLHARV
jgi:hypothetical protein